MLKSNTWLILLIVIVVSASLFYALGSIGQINIDKKTIDNQDYIIGSAAQG